MCAPAKQAPPYGGTGGRKPERGGLLSRWHFYDTQSHRLMYVFKIRRVAKSANATFGFLLCNGVQLCRTLEPVDRGLSSSMSIATINARKVRGFTAIPTGNYSLRLTFSPRFSVRPFYNALAGGGLLPLVCDVPGFSRILMHCGNTYRDTAGCVLLGAGDLNALGGDYRLVSSRATYRDVFTHYLYPALRFGATAPLRVSSVY